MLADFFTKPLQGNLFRKFCEVIMGRKHINTLQEIKLPPLQERVGESDFCRVDNGQKTDGNCSEPKETKKVATYTEVATKALHNSHESERRSTSSHFQKIILLEKWFD